MAESLVFAVVAPATVRPDEQLQRRVQLLGDESIHRLRTARTVAVLASFAAAAHYERIQHAPIGAGMKERPKRAREMNVKVRRGSPRARRGGG
jgi:hypothetical protein